MDLFEERAASPMLIARQDEAFDHPDWIYELKMDGFRCLAYIDEACVDFRNKRNLRMASRFPELSDLYRNVSGKCILDGEIVVLKNGSPDFFALQKRTLLTDQFKIKLEASRFPASFVAFDCIYENGRELQWKPLMRRKRILKEVVMENDRIAVSRYVEGCGIALYQATEQRELEGIVAKRKDSVYLMGKRSRDWIKCKRIFDEEFIVAGYIRKGKDIYSLILAKYEGASLAYRGHVTSGVTEAAVSVLTVTGKSPFQLHPKANPDAVWVKPDHVCIVQYMPNTKNTLRQPVFKGYRQDVCPEEIISIP